MAFFFKRKKKTEDQGAAAPGVTPDGAAAASANGEEGDSKAFKPDPDKARKWFEHAKSMADRFDYGYALFLYANGIKFDPESISAHEAMLETAIKYMNQEGKPASNKDLKAINDGSPVARMAAAEFAWFKDYRNPTLACRTLEAAVKAGQLEFGHWIAARVLNLVRSQKKVNKNALLSLMELFKKVHAWDEAIAAGEAALQLDPTDSALGHELKDLAAQRAMDQGGYEAAAGEEGGFRKFVKDSDKQRELQEAEAISASADVETRNLERARLEYEKNPTQPDAINRYGQLLKRKGTPEALDKAYEVYMTGFETVKEYRFRMLAGDIQIDKLSRELRELEEQLEADAENESLKQEHAEKRKALLELQANEYAERVMKYPTDRQRKYELGAVLFELSRCEEAMGQFQAAKEEPRLRVRAGHLLGRCFALESWHPEAIAEYREALEAIDVTEQDRELEIRYDLMVSLIELARSEQSLETAREALEICSTIARRNITYHDIRERRKEIDQLVRELS